MLWLAQARSSTGPLQFSHFLEFQQSCPVNTERPAHAPIWSKHSVIKYDHTMKKQRKNLMNKKPPTVIYDTNYIPAKAFTLDLLPTHYKFNLCNYVISLYDTNKTDGKHFKLCCTQSLPKVVKSSVYDQSACTEDFFRISTHSFFVWKRKNFFI